MIVPLYVLVCVVTADRTYIVSGLLITIKFTTVGTKGHICEEQ